MILINRISSGLQFVGRVAKNSEVVFEKILQPRECAAGIYVQKRDGGGGTFWPRFRDCRYPPRRWYLLQKKHKQIEEDITRQNNEFLEDYKKQHLSALRQSSPLKDVAASLTETIWDPNQRRTGLIARKLGTYPMWTKKGKKVLMTLLHVSENQVIKYTPPEEFLQREENKKFRTKLGGRCGTMVVGAEDGDPELYTGAYNSIFQAAGVPVKRRLARFFVTPEAALPPGTPLSVMHFQPGDYVDVWGKTTNHGYQGVMRRHGFKGGPKTFGCTKSHRRPGCVGSGKRRGILKGTKMPGKVGNKWRIIKGLKVRRVNTKENVIYVAGLVPGFNNSFVKIRDTCLFNRKRKEQPNFPTYFPERSNEPVPENLYDDELHQMDAPSITFTDEPPPQQDLQKISADLEKIKKLFRI